MQKASPRIDRYQIAIGLTILAGVLLRVGHLFFIDPNAPFRLGGLFLEFSNQIINNHFSLPVNIPYYSENGLPFAYPPLSFYFQALLINLFHPAKFLTVNIIPPVAAALSVPAFYYLAKQLTSSRLETWSVLAAYAFIPNAFLDQIEAAGLPEAFGELALIWYAVFLIKVYKRPGWAAAVAAGILLGINILSSPGSAVAAPVLSLLFTLLVLLRSIKDRRFQALAMPVAIGMIGLIVSAPYWVTVITQHGRGIFLGALFNQFQTGQRLSFLQQSLDRLLTFNFSSIRNNSFLWSSLTFLGLIAYLTGPGFYMPVLFILFSLLPREGIWLSAMAATFLAGKGLVLVIQYIRSNLGNLLPARRRLVEYLLMSIFLVVASYSAFYAVRGIVNDRQWALDAQQAAALESHAGAIPQAAKVIVVGNDAFLEWAPQLLQREVINTPYGLEWEPHELNRVNKFIKDLESAGTFDALMTAIKQRFHLQDVYLVTDDRARFSNSPGSPGPGLGTVDVLVDEENLQIYHLVIE